MVERKKTGLAKARKAVSACCPGWYFSGSTDTGLRVSTHGSSGKSRCMYPDQSMLFDHANLYDVMKKLVLDQASETSPLDCGSRCPAIRVT